MYFYGPNVKEPVMIQSPEDMQRMVNAKGFLPFFKGEIPGFSVEEATAAAYWFPDEGDGVWDWKGPVIVEGDCAYGKFCCNKACYISMEWFPDFVNYRRSRYVLTPDEQHLLTVLQEHRTLLSRELKTLCGYGKPRSPRLNPLEKILRKEETAVVKQKRERRESFDTAITRLQMSAHVLIADFEYSHDRQGKRYGFAVARYCTPEDFFGEERLLTTHTPEESGELIFRHLRTLLPQAEKEQLLKIVG